MSDDLTRCYGSVKECVQFIPHTSSFERIETLYSQYLKALGEKPNCNSFESFYLELVALERVKRMALENGQPGPSPLSKMMVACFEKMKSERKIVSPRWAYTI